MEQEIHLFNFHQRRSSVLVIQWSFEWTAIQGRTRWMDRQRQGQESAGAGREPRGRDGSPRLDALGMPPPPSPALGCSLGPEAATATLAGTRLPPWTGLPPPPCARKGCKRGKRKDRPSGRD